MIAKHLPTFVLSILTAVAVWVGSSVAKLNENVATVIERTVSHEKRLDKIEERLQ